MKRFTTIILNGIFFFIIAVIAFIVTTIAFTKRINETRAQYDNGISATVVKQMIPILSLSQGVVKKIYVRIGEKVKKNELLVELDNPALQGKIQALQNYPDNVSAQTEASVAIEELKGLRIYAPVDGVVTEVLTSEGSPVEALTKLLNLYSNDHILLLAHLTNDQYQVIQHMQEASAYSPRLNQNFVILPDILQPDVTMDPTAYQKEIGLYFTFKDANEAQSLLNNEDLQLEMQLSNNKVLKPVDYIVNFWNSLLDINYAKH